MADIEFEIAGDHHAGRAEKRAGAPRRPASVRGKSQTAEQRADDAGHLLPALERTVGNARVDEHKWHMPLIESNDRVGPDFGFGNQRQVGLPMIEKATHVTRHVEGHELMGRARRQTPRDQSAEVRVPGGDEDSQATLRQSLDHRKQGQRFADAGAMHPHQVALRSRAAGIAFPFAKSRAVLAALAADANRAGRAPPVRGRRSPRGTA